MKKNISTFWKKITGALFTFFGIGTLTACYGAPPSDYIIDDGLFMVYGTITGAKDSSSNTPQLKNIKVYTKNSPDNYTTTNEYGYYELYFDTTNNVTIYFEDNQNNIYQIDSAQLNFDETKTLSCNKQLKKK